MKGRLITTERRVCIDNKIKYVAHIEISREDSTKLTQLLIPDSDIEVNLEIIKADMVEKVEG